MDETEKLEVAEMQDKFRKKWSADLDNHFKVKKQILDRNDALNITCKRLKVMHSKFKMLISSTDFFPVDCSDVNKAEMFNFYVKNYFACLILGIDDAIFLRNGRLLFRYRIDCTPENEIDPDRVNYHHNSFVDNGKENVKLSKICSEYFLRVNMTLKKSIKDEFLKMMNDMKAFLEPEQQKLTVSVRKGILLTPAFIQWYDGVIAGCKNVLEIHTMEENCADQETELRGCMTEVIGRLKGSDVNKAFCSETFKYRKFGTEFLVVNRDLIKRILVKKASILRRCMENETILDSAKFDCKLARMVEEKRLLEIEKQGGWSVPEDNSETASKRTKDKKVASQLSNVDEEFSGNENAQEDCGYDARMNLANDGFIADENDGNDGGFVENDEGSDNECGDESENRNLVEDDELDSVHSTSKHTGKFTKKKLLSVVSVGAKRKIRYNEHDSPVLYNSTLYDPSLPFLTNMKLKDVTLQQALETGDKATANAIIDCMFSYICVEDVVADVSDGIVREQNVTGFAVLKRLAMECTSDEVNVFDFNSFFKGVATAAYDRMKIRSTPVQDGGTGCLAECDRVSNSMLHKRIDTSVNRIRLKVVFLYARFNGTIDKLDLSKFKRCGFLQMFRGKIVNCTLPLVDSSVIDIFESPAFSEDSFADFQNTTLCKKLSKGELSRLEVEAKEVAAKKKQKRDEKKNVSSVVTSSNVDFSSASASSVKSLSVINQPISGNESFDNSVGSGQQLLESEGSDQQLLENEESDQQLLENNERISPTKYSPIESTSFSSPSHELNINDAMSFTYSTTSPSTSKADSSPSSTTASLECDLSTSDIDLMGKGSSQCALSSAEINNTLKVLSDLVSGTVGKYNVFKLMIENVSKMKTKEVLAWVNLIIFIAENRGDDNVIEMICETDLLNDIRFGFYIAYPVTTSGDSVIGYSNTRGDGYCLFRSTAQALFRLSHPNESMDYFCNRDKNSTPDRAIALHIQSYMKYVKYSHPYTQALVSTMLEETLYNATTFPNKPNSRECWGNAADWIRFLPFHVSLLEFNIGNEIVVSNSGTRCKYGRLSRIPFHVFGRFYYESPRLSVSELRKFANLPSNYIAKVPSHFHLLDHPTSDQPGDLERTLRSWLSEFVKVVATISATSLSQIFALRDIFMKRNDVETSTHINNGVEDVDVDKDSTGHIMDKDNLPMCTEWMVSSGPDAGCSRDELSEIMKSMEFLRKRVESLKKKIDNNQQKASPMKTLLPVAIVDIAGQEDIEEALAKSLCEKTCFTATDDKAEHVNVTVDDIAAEVKA